MQKEDDAFDHILEDSVEILEWIRSFDNLL